MNKATSILFAALTSVAFASSAIAASPTHHDKTHHTAIHHPSLQQQATLPKNDASSKLETKTAALK